MGTPFLEIADLALITIRDYRIDKLMRNDEVSAYKYLEGFIIRAIPEFDKCRKSLDYDMSTSSFIEELDVYEKNILAKWAVIKWWESITQVDILVNDVFQGKDKKTHSAQANLKAKSLYKDKLLDEIDVTTQKYSLNNMFKEKGV